MIKICSLDFLNRENFETDVMKADGSILFHSNDEITPDIILKLYFQDIYVEESFLKEEPEAAEQNVEIAVGAISIETESENITSKGPRFVDMGDAENTENASGPRSIDTNFMKEEETSSSGPRSVETDAEEEKSALKGPRSVDMGDEAEESGSSGPRSIETNASEEKHVSSGPRSIETEGKEEKTASAGPRSIDTSFAAEKEISEQEHSTKDSVEDIKEDIPKNPEEEPLVFDEEQANKIVAHSIKLGKILKFSNDELKELEQVAYYYNIGITDFKKLDLSKTGFRKRKVFASYEKLLNSGIVPNHIADMIKLCANSYESETFQLDSKIPYYHIVALTSFYEELLARNNSKQATLLKILQMGGNQFNIFILHKFIKTMRETNE